MSFSQIVVQACHSCLSQTFQPNDPHLVVLSAKNQDFLYKVAKKLDMANVKYKMFIEPDMGNEATAICTEPIYEDKRKIFKNYQCIKEKK